MKKFLTSFAIVCAANGAYAQFYIPDGQPIPNVTSVTNEGVAVGYNDQNQPFYIWDAVNNTQKLIGGISAGQGVGGMPHFSADGKLIAAPMQSDKINVYTEWSANTFEKLAPYKFSQIYYYSDYNLFAIGSTPDGTSGHIFKSVDNGVSWKENAEISLQNEDGSWHTLLSPDFPVYCMAPGTSPYYLIVGGGNGMLLRGRGNGSWEKAELTGLTLDQPIKAYRDMSFTTIKDQWNATTADKGCILLELEDGSRTVVYTLDATETFSVSEGFAANPRMLANNGKDIFLGTSDGLIQRSQDGGKTWTTVCTDESNRAFNRIVFADENKGVALTDNVIYITRDGGATWTLTEVFPSFGVGFGNNSTWQDAAWLDDFFMIVGTNGCCYRSDDDGATFKKVDGLNGDLSAIFYDSRKAYTIMGEAGQVWHKAKQEYISGYTAGMYDVEKDTWTPMASTGVVSDAASSPWNISGDGKHTVGIAYDINSASGTVVPYAAIWDGIDKVTTLDNYFGNQGRACRANAVSYDGSVIAGWQDVWGPWYGSIWSKQTDGSYKQTLLSTDPEMNIEDLKFETNDDKLASTAKLVGACQAVSSDGKWVGGRGMPGMGADGAWIWNEEDGFTVVYPDMDSTVADMNADASVVVGWVGPGGSAWIWTKKEGRMDLQEYVESKLGYSLNNFGIAGVYDMSPNGRYICGFGMYGETPTAYVFDLFHTVGIDEMEAAQVKATVYPNPASDELHVDLPFDYTELPTTLTLVSMQGQVVKQVKNPAVSNVIDIRGLGAGIYLLDVNANGSHKTFKVIVK